MTDLSHYSPRPINKVCSMVQPGEVKGWHFQPKPCGLWLSVDGEDDWRAWCEAEGFRLDTLKHRYRVYLRSDANILRLTTPEETLAFTEAWRKVDELTAQSDILANMYIDWPRLAKHYQGLIIAPYQWSLRLDLMWYYSWDCASGCVWDAGAVERIEEVT